MWIFHREKGFDFDETYLVSFHFLDLVSGVMSKDPLPLSSSEGIILCFLLKAVIYIYMYLQLCSIWS